MNRRISTAAAALAAAVGLMVGAFAAETSTAHTTKLHSRVTALGSTSAFQTYFSGSVFSRDADACEPDRRVKLFRVRNGPDAFLGADRTGSPPDPPGGDENDYIIYTEHPLGKGNYYTKVTREDIGPPQHDHICEGDRSGVIEYEPPDWG